ncbi:hypothetical protein DLQ17_26865, partial [Salmonella enterica]|nr:hypothetical protein [Salmonella enterica]
YYNTLYQLTYFTSFNYYRLTHFINSNNFIQTIYRPITKLLFQFIYTNASIRHINYNTIGLAT